MRVLFLSNVGSSLKLFRGELLEALLAQNHTVYVAFPADDYGAILEQMGCKVVDVQFGRRTVNPIDDLKLIRTYRKLIEEVAPDLVLTYTIKPNVYGGIVCRLNKIPYISNITGLGTSIENSGILQMIALVLYRLGLKKAECIFYQNAYNKAFMEQKHVRGKTAKLLPGSGVNILTHPYQPYPIEDREIRFLYAGRIMKDKGIEELIACAKEIRSRHSNVVFSLAGGYDAQEYVEEICELEEENILQYLGWRNDIQNLIAYNHCIIHPSYHEGLSNTLLDAAACGRPVIATNVAGCKETFDDGITGFGVPARDAKALIAAVEKFISLSYAEKAEMGRRGREKVEKEFNREIVINAYLSEMQKIGIKER